MGLFGKLFDKKTCDFCNGDIGLLGNRKLSDGNMCKECAKQISPWMTDRKKQSVEEMEAHLQDREQNKEKVAAFQTTRVIGDRTKLYLDENNGWWLVTRSKKFKEENPDVFSFSQVTGCDPDIDENLTEIRRELEDGRRVSYEPPRYDYDYNFYVTIHLNHPWIPQIRYQVNTTKIDNRFSPEYQEAQRRSQEVHDALTQIREASRADIEKSKEPQQSVTCALCGATTTPDAGGRCEYCGGVAQA